MVRLVRDRVPAGARRRPRAGLARTPGPRPPALDGGAGRPGEVQCRRCRRDRDHAPGGGACWGAMLSDRDWRAALAGQSQQRDVGAASHLLRGVRSRAGVECGEPRCLPSGQCIGVARIRSPTMTRTARWTWSLPRRPGVAANSPDVGGRTSCRFQGVGVVPGTSTATAPTRTATSSARRYSQSAPRLLLGVPAGKAYVAQPTAEDIAAKRTLLRLQRGDEELEKRSSIEIGGGVLLQACRRSRSGAGLARRPGGLVVPAQRRRRAGHHADALEYPRRYPGRPAPGQGGRSGALDVRRPRAISVPLRPGHLGWHPWPASVTRRARRRGAQPEHRQRRRRG